MNHIAGACLSRRLRPGFARFSRTTPNWSQRSSRPPRARWLRSLRVATPGAGRRPSWRLCSRDPHSYRDWFARFGFDIPLELLSQWGSMDRKKIIKMWLLG